MKTFEDWLSSKAHDRQSHFLPKKRPMRCDDSKVVVCFIQGSADFTLALRAPLLCCSVPACCCYIVFVTYSKYSFSFASLYCTGHREMTERPNPDLRLLAGPSA